MSKLTQAFANSERSYLAAKASVAQVTSELLARGPGGVPTHRPDLARASEQLRHFKGWVYASIRPIAQRLAMQPIHVGRISATTPRLQKRHQPVNVEPLERHELLDLFHDPNDLMVAWSLVFSMVASLELTGRCLWWLPGQQQILPIPTSWIRAFEGTTRFTSFKVQPPHTGETFDLPADECVYLCYPNPADPQGAVSPLQAVAGAVDADEAITNSQVSMFRRGIHPSHAVIVGKNAHPDNTQGVRPRLTAAQQRQIISAIRKRYADTQNHGEPLILDGLIEDVRKLSNTPAEMDWLASGQSTKARIAQGFGTNPIIMGEIEGANRASALVAEQHFCDYTLNPKIELISQCLTEWLRPMFGNDIVVWIEPCYPHDSENSLQWVDRLIKAKAITGDELRELSPFDLEVGKYPETVASDPVDDAAESLRRVTANLDTSIEREANRILALSNGRP